MRMESPTFISEMSDDYTSKSGDHRFLSVLFKAPSRVCRVLSPAQSHLAQLSSAMRNATLGLARAIARSQHPAVMHFDARHLLAIYDANQTKISRGLRVS
jgi:hypothetical protein